MTHHVACCCRSLTNFGSQWLKELAGQFGPDCVVHVNVESGMLPPSFIRFMNMVEHPTSEIKASVAAHYGIDPGVIQRLFDVRPTMRKVLFLLFLRIQYGLKYAVVTGDDHVLLAPIPDVVALSSEGVPFLVPGWGDVYGDSSTEPMVSDFLRRNGFKARYSPTFPDSGFYSDFIGMDLTVFDKFTPAMVLEVCETNFRWLDQALLIQLNCCSETKVLGFGPHDRLRALCYNDWHYPELSRIYHASATPHKWVCHIVRFYKEFGGWSFWWVLMRALFILPDIKGRIARLMQRRGHSINWFYQYEKRV